ncbi:MAG: hypothetical protein EZS28_027703, partial [Streblomastix strix]
MAGIAHGGVFNRFNSGIFKGRLDGQRVIDFKGRGKFRRGNRKRNFDSVESFTSSRSRLFKPVINPSEKGVIINLRALKSNNQVIQNSNLEFKFTILSRSIRQLQLNRRQIALQQSNCYQIKDYRSAGPNYGQVDAALGGRDHRSVQLSNIEDYCRAGLRFGPEDVDNELRDEESQQIQQDQQYQLTGSQLQEETDSINQERLNRIIRRNDQRICNAKRIDQEFNSNEFISNTTKNISLERANRDSSMQFFNKTNLNIITGYGTRSGTELSDNEQQLSKIQYEFPNWWSSHSFSPSMVTNWSRQSNQERYQSILDSLRMSINSTKEQVHPNREQIRSKYDNSGLIDQQVIGGEDSNRGPGERFKLDKSVFRNIKARNKQVEEDNRLLNTQQVSPVVSLHNGGYQYSQGINVRGILDVQDRSGVSIPSYSCGSSIPTFSGFYTQGKVLQICSNVLRSQTCTLTFYKVLLPVIRIIREHLEQRGSSEQTTSDPMDTRRIRLENIRKLIKPASNIRSGISRLASSFQSGSNTNDVGQENIDVEEVQQMEKHCLKESLGQDKATSKFHRVFELSKTTNQEGGLYLRKLNKIKQRIANNRDASLDSWGATLKLQKLEEEIWFQGDWCKKWRLSSSNQRETAAVLCGLTRSERFLKRKQVTSLKIETDNSATSYNLNRGAAAASLRKLTDRILKIVEDLYIHIHSFHIQGKTNIIPDSLSRLAT